MKEKQGRGVLLTVGKDGTRMQTDRVFVNDMRKGAERIRSSEERRSKYFVIREIRLLHWIFSITIPLPGLSVSQ